MDFAASDATRCDFGTRTRARRTTAQAKRKTVNDKPKFISNAVTREARLPLGTPLNPYRPEWPRMPPGVKPPEKRLHGRRSLCRSCGQYFNGVEGFDQHRVGGGSARRCLTPAELAAKGWVLRADGFWSRPPPEKRISRRGVGLHAAQVRPPAPSGGPDVIPDSHPAPHGPASQTPP